MIYFQQYVTLKSFFQNKKEDKQKQFIELIGEGGLGKSYCLLKIFEELKLDWYEIDLGINREIPFGALVYNLQLNPSNSTYRDLVYNKLNQIIKQGKIIYFSNYEVCDADSRIIIENLIDFYYKSKSEICIVIENNSAIPQVSQAINIVFKPCKENILKEYAISIIDGRQEVINKIVKMATGNIMRLIIICKIINHIYIKCPFTETKYNFSCLHLCDIPESLISAYVRYYEFIDEELRPIIKIISSLGSSFYEELLKEAFHNDIYIDGLRRIKDFNTIIQLQKLNYCNLKIKSKYSFIIPEAYKVVLQKNGKDKQNIIKPYLQYLKDLVGVESVFEKYTISEKIIILQSIISNHYITNNILEYSIRLLHIYYKEFAFENTIQWGQKLLDYTYYNQVQINKRYEDYFTILLNSYILTGKYDEAIKLEQDTISAQEKCLIAKAYYLKGNPIRALNILENIKNADNYFDVLNLKASIYNWLSEMRLSKKYILKAYRIATKEQQYSIVKKIDLDLDLPEFKRLLNKALEYYKNSSKKEYAEVLFNIGTSKLFSASPQEQLDGYAQIVNAEILFNEICDKDSWYCQNSLAIFHALHFEFDEAIQIWERIMEQSKGICFCELTIYLNIVCALLKNGNMTKANIYLEKTSNRIFEYANYKNYILHLNRDDEFEKITKDRPEINLCIRNYFLMKALLCKLNGGEKEMRKYARRAKHSSNYNSSSDYLIYNLSHTILKHIGKNYIKRFFADNEMYFCPVMFWE